MKLYLYVTDSHPKLGHIYMEKTCRGEGCGGADFGVWGGSPQKMKKYIMIQLN